jgi:hypothetical protein
LAQRLHRFRWLLIAAPHLGHLRDLRFIFSAVRGLLFIAVVTRVLAMENGPPPKRAGLVAVDRVRRDSHPPHTNPKGRRGKLQRCTIAGSATAGQEMQVGGLQASGRIIANVAASV